MRLKKIGLGLLLSMGVMSVSLGMVTASAADTSLIVPIERKLETGTYLDLNSINVRRYDPPYYIIEATIISDDYDSGKVKFIKERFFYDYDKKILRVALLSTDTKYRDGSRHHYDENKERLGEPKEGSLDEYIANVVFYRAYNMFFSPSYQKEQTNTGIDILAKVRGELK